MAKEIVLSNEESFLQEFMYKTGVSKVISGYNNWVDNLLPRQLSEMWLDVKRGDKYYKVGFFNVVVHRPYCEEDINKPLYPNVARLQSLSYVSDVTADIRVMEYKNGEFVTILPKPIEKDVILTNDLGLSNHLLCKIPTMVRSNKCNLTVSYDNQSSLDKFVFDHEECPNDIGGYFVISGSERVIMAEQSLRNNKPFIMNSNKKKPVKFVDFDEKAVCETRYTYKSDNGLSVVRLYTSDSDCLYVTTDLRSVDKECGLFVANVFEVLQYYNEDFHCDTKESIDSTFDFILRFVKNDENVREKCRYKLHPSLQQFLSMKGNHTVKHHKCAFTLFENLFTEINDKRCDIMSESDVKYMRLGTLCKMIGHTLEYLTGIRACDDRDSWVNCKVDTAGRMLEILFSSVFAAASNYVVPMLSTDSPNEPISKVIKQSMKKFESTISCQLRESMLTLWGAKACRSGRRVKNAMIQSSILPLTKSAKRKLLKEQRSMNNLPYDSNDEDSESESDVERGDVPSEKEFKQTKFISYSKSKDVTQALKRETLLSMYSQLSRLTIPVKHDSASVKIRLVHQSQLGYVCVAETPEGTKCGLNKSIALTAVVSNETKSFCELLQVIRKMMASFPDNNGVVKSPVFLNGVFIGFSCTRELYSLLYYNNEKSIPFDSCVIVEDGMLLIYCDGGRLCRPLLLVDKNDDVDMKSEYVVYVDSWEQSMIMLCPSFEQFLERKRYETELFGVIKRVYTEVRVEDVKILRLLQFNGLLSSSLDVIQSFLKQKNLFTDIINFFPLFDMSEINGLCDKLSSFPIEPYTHCEISPLSILGIIGSTNPAVNYNQAPRNSYQCKMSQQSMSGYSLRLDKRFDTNFKVLTAPVRTMFDTLMRSVLKMNRMPNGDTPIVAFLAMADNQEDAFIVKKEAIERGLFQYMKYITRRYDMNADRVLGRSERTDDDIRFRNIGPDGLPYLGVFVKKGDCIIAMKRGDEDSSIFAKIDDAGFVDKIYVPDDFSYVKRYMIRFRIPREPMVGDKFAFQYAQKGTISKIVRAVNMPVIMFGPMKGMTPDFIVNSHCIPSRMTMGEMYEFIGQKQAMLTCERVNATSFRKLDLEGFQSVLKQNGFDEWGNERFMDGVTSDLLDNPVFCGPCYSQPLQHNVLDKIQARGFGKHQPDTFQPVTGRSNEGGLRVGEMDRDALLSHAASEVLNERFSVVSDKWKTFICKNCGSLIARDSKFKNFVCRLCRLGHHEFQVEHVGVIEISYIWKYMSQLLASLNINVMFTTEIKQKGVVSAREELYSAIQEEESYELETNQNPEDGDDYEIGGDSDENDDYGDSDSNKDDDDDYYDNDEEN